MDIRHMRPHCLCRARNACVIPSREYLEIAREENAKSGLGNEEEEEFPRTQRKRSCLRYHIFVWLICVPCASRRILAYVLKVLYACEHVYPQFPGNVWSRCCP